MRIFQKLTRYTYKLLIKPILFRFDAEKVHEKSTKIGEFLGRYRFTRFLLRFFYAYNDISLHQELKGVCYKNPIGLAAGFDYEARLPKVLSALGFGASTVGTITNKAYRGNPGLRLGRLPKSKSLWVNKGLKNEGIKKALQRLRVEKNGAVIGLSIAATNTKENSTENRAITDIIEAFKTAETSDANFDYYELNISCPNLFVCIDFYSPNKLRVLLDQVTGLKLNKPLFIKMPISKTDEEIKEMLDIIIEFPIEGVIFGNLQKNRTQVKLDQTEVEKFKDGNFSGKPTEDRANELIVLAYRDYQHKLIIIGCGGIFSAKDAYKKIRYGATLLQMITGLVFEGPQVIGEINQGLSKLLKKDGFSHISQAVGVDAWRATEES